MSTPAFELATAPLGDGTVLIEASAGTGKTYTLTGILLRLLLEQHITQVEQALVVTFTIAATDELKHRLRRGLLRALAVCEGGADDDPFFDGLRGHGAEGARILRQALDDFDRVGIHTIHGFCKRLLDESAFESHEPFRFDFASDEVPLWHAAAEDALRVVREHDSPTLGALLHDEELTPAALIKLYRLWQRYPDVQLEQPQPQLAIQLELLRAAVHNAAAAFDGATAARLEGARWKRGKDPFGSDVARHRFGEQLASTPEYALDLLSGFARSRLGETVIVKTLSAWVEPFFDACEVVHTQQLEATQHLRSALLLHLHDRLRRHKDEHRVLAFQDLLVRTHAALHDPERGELLRKAVLDRFRVALIDEFQDTDPLQYGIFAKLFAHRPLFLVGDPKQSIYGFRGADLHTYLTARKHAPQQATLPENHRSSPQLVLAVSQLFERPHAFVAAGLELLPVRARAKADQLQLTGDPGPALRFRFVPPQPGGGLWRVHQAEPRLAADVAAEICRLLHRQVQFDGKPLLPRHIAVLTRTNRQATLVQDTLRAVGVPAAIGKAGDVFETDEIDEIERVLLAILQPTNLQRARGAMATRLWGFCAAELQALEVDETRFEQELSRLDDWRALWLRRGFVVMKERLLEDVQAKARLLQTIGGERRLTNCQQVFELLHEAELTHRLSPEGLVEWLQHERLHKDQLDYEQRELRLESDEDAVQILTVHGSKGLQYEVVFCPFLWGGRNAPLQGTVLGEPGRRRLVPRTKTDDPAWHASEIDRLAEDTRLCYVALTRARRRCYVHWGAMGTNRSGAGHSALAWLLQPDPVDLATQGAVKDWSRQRLAALVGWHDELQAFVGRSGGTMGLDEVPLVPVPQPVPPMDLPAARPARIATRRPQSRSLHSFTSLVANTHPHVLTEAPEIADPPVATPAMAAPGRGIFGFRRGADAGQCLHAVLERVDLGDLDSERTGRVIQSTLQQFGLADAAAHPGEVEPAADVLGMLRAVAGAHVMPDGPTLGALCRLPGAIEWQFTLPTIAAPLASFAVACQRSGGEIARSYADRLRTLPPRTLHGFLGGFADLIAEHEGRYWLIDWKSNHLGARPEDYDPDALRRAMFEHDYVLQYLLYLLALHRHLQRRLPGYDPERHLGGVCYVFLRGAVAGTSNGMFFDRPPASLLQALDQWAAGAAR